LNRNHTTARRTAVAVVACLGLTLLACVVRNTSTMKLSDLKGWMTVSPNPVAAGQPVTRLSYMYNGHASEWAFIDSAVIDTLHFDGVFNVLPGDTTSVIDQTNVIYPLAGTYVHHLTFYTEVGILTCPPCTVIVQ
jgi:hypothetical protein